MQEVSKLILTCSGGPFFGASRQDLQKAALEQAMKHPNWSMGPKITIDSATLMNKGLEAIEAHHIFDIDIDKIEVLVHRQSRVHSMVELCDGTVLAQIGASDMRLPIQYALSYPERWPSPVARTDLSFEPPLSFEKADIEVFRCLKLAFDACRIGKTMPCAMNAANEVANEAFIKRQCNLDAIADVVEFVMEQTEAEEVVSLGQLEEADALARLQATRYIRSLS